MFRIAVSTPPFCLHISSWCCIWMLLGTMSVRSEQPTPSEQRTWQVELQRLLTRENHRPRATLAIQLPIVDSEQWTQQAWLAAGGEAADYAPFQQRLLQWRRQARQELLLASQQNSHPQQLLAWLHQHLLKTYHADATSLRGLWQSGHFNCVSATWLYQVIARDLGYRTQTLCRDRHCRVAVWHEQQWLPIETTCANCSRAPAAAIPGINQAASSPERQLSDAGLLGLFWFNRAVDSLAAKQYRQAALWNLQALECDQQNQAAQMNLVASLNHLALQAMQQQHWRSAKAWLSFASQISPSDETTLHNERYWQLKQQSAADFWPTDNAR